MRLAMAAAGFVLLIACGKSQPAATPSPTAVAATPAATPVPTAAPTPAASSGSSSTAATPRAATSDRPIGAKCKDGTYDYGTTSHTACSGHGGVGTSY